MNIPELVRIWLKTLFPDSLSATMDFSSLFLACKHEIEIWIPNKNKKNIQNVTLILSLK